MGAPATPVPLPDAAFAAFKAAEGTLSSDQASLANANAALAAAQTAQQSAASTVNTDTANATDAANTLIASLQAYVAGLNPAPATPSGS